jgi:PBSX family phage terminase large subunit
MTTPSPIEVLPQQMRFLQSEAREVIYSGAFGAGKSRAICLKVAIRASIPNSREGLCRKTMVSLKKTTLKTLLEPDGELAPILPVGTYEYKKGDAEINIIGGGTIILFGLDSPERVASMNLSGCAVDECVELTASDWVMLRGRIRMKLPELKNQLYGACNPSSPQHWLAERFGLADSHICSKNCEAVITKTTDNWYLPPDYVEDLMTLTGVAKRRFVFGEWAGSDGLVYDRWQASSFVSSDMPESFDRMIVSCDEGYNHPSVMLAIGEKDERLFVVNEWYKRGMLEVEMIEAAQNWCKEYPIETFYVDPSAAKLIAAMRHDGIDAQPAQNAVFAGINAVSSRLSMDGKGRPRLTVAPICNNLIREFGVYEWKSDKEGTLKDEPVKAYDHALDALRYGIVAIDGIRTTPQIRDFEDANTKIAAWEDERLWTEM